MFQKLPIRRLYEAVLVCLAFLVLIQLAVLFSVHRQNGTHSGNSLRPINFILYHDDRTISTLNCREKYGIKMFDVWKSTKLEMCTNESTSKISCYYRYDGDVKRRLCLLLNTKIRLHEPYYNASTSDLSSPATVHMLDDIVSADCEPVANYNGKAEHKIEFDSLFHVDKFNASRQVDLQCSHTVPHTVFWIYRWDATNAFHYLEDVTNTFVSLILLDENPNQVEIAIYDGMTGIVNNPLFTLWSELFPKGVRIIRNDPFPRDSCFARSITSMYGSRSIFTEFGGFKKDTLCTSPILKGFRDWALDSLQIERSAPTPTTNLTLLFVSRKQYLPTRQITRVLQNEDAILQAISSTFPSLNVIVFRPEEYSTFKEQAAIASKANIMLGVHGAGLVYNLFMSPGSHLIEIFMDDRPSTNRHFRNIATWMDLNHSSISHYGRSIPPKLILDKIDEALKEINKRF